MPYMMESNRLPGFAT